MASSSLDRLAALQWHQLSTTEAQEYLQTDLVKGLSATEIPQRRELYGFNQLQGKPEQSLILRFLMEFNQPLIYLLLLAGVVALLMREWVDAGAIFAVTLVNATIGFVQESKAENAIAALAKSVTTEATAIRDGQKIRLDSRELVPGDLVLLASGDKVPADLRLVSLRDLQVSEAGLTGESVPVPKATAGLAAATVLADRTNMAYAGSLVTFGQAQGLVVAIGDRTEYRYGIWLRSCRHDFTTRTASRNRLRRSAPGVFGVRLVMQRLSHSSAGWAISCRRRSD